MSFGEEGGGIELMLELGRKGESSEAGGSCGRREGWKRSTFKLLLLSSLSYFSLE